MNLNPNLNLSTSTEIAIKTRPDKKHPIMEIFGPTIQGEGMLLGMKTMFIRFGGCDYRCGKCDSMHAVLPELIHQDALYMTDREITAEVNKKAQDSSSCSMVTFSGGNPCIHEL